MNAPLYVDTSGLAKFVLNEQEGPALDKYLGENEFTLVSSELTEVELVRAATKKNPKLAPIAREVVRSLVLLPISSSVRALAGDLYPGRAKSLDAIHLATALEIKTDLAGILTYDNQMAKLASEAGITILKPA